MSKAMDGEDGGRGYNSLYKTEYVLGGKGIYVTQSGFYAKHFIKSEG